ncbi:universal stress protein [Novosphingobium album (ex Liu et al. 2023)]|uniref:Universal stress protein n=1 Tax=Novosphingobium album (ex Liu et al. 2023) TaxID=3031130 RepID=A0ABT5WS09_9SPHN|nr:universal stress protein [Novosphingobium album (ex Liu et al. 2023)]MDE8652817.1 universal stress protein [Novosphingobium album (ex Liu et al. 2023)]
MTEPTFIQPRKILVATDLTPRCDRAVDRAVQLAEEFGAELIAAHIMDPTETPQYYIDRSRRSWRRLPDPVERMRWRLKRDLAGASEKIRVIVEEGNPAEKLVDLAIREQCDLIVTGDAGPESLSRMIFGSTVNRIVRGSTAPVLMVHDRPTRRYRDIVIATDFSEASLQALRSVAAFFPKSDLTLFHGYDIPYAGFIVDRDIESELRSIEKEITAKFMSDPRIEPKMKSRTAVVIQHGSPEALLGDFIDDRSIDLTVIGSHGRGAIFDALIGSNAKRLVERLEGDLLIVRYVEDA